MSKSVLVVTEEPIARYLLRLVLERDGYEVFDADYGLDALNQVRETYPDILILDTARRARYHRHEHHVHCRHCHGAQRRSAPPMRVLLVRRSR